MVTRIVYEGDIAVARTHLTAAQNLMYKVREFVRVSGVRVFGSHLVLDEVSYAHCLKIEDQETIHIFSQPQSSTETVEIETTSLPDFLSGVIFNGVIRYVYEPRPDGSERRRPFLDYFRPSAVCARRLRVAEAFQSSERLAVKPSRIYMSDFIGDNGNEDRSKFREFSQYHTIRPSNYTGRMATLVQIIYGFGKIPESTIIEKDPKTRAEYIKEGIQVVYDCRYYRSHGVVIGEDGQQWLVEISSLNGVIAMRLPLYPKSQYLADSKQVDIAQAVTEFGGLPTGQGFPTGKKLAAAIASGEILQLAPASDLAAYYACVPYYSMCGWAFSTQGTEAHNTGWTYGDDYVIRGSHFSLQIRIGALVRDRKPNAPIAVASAHFTTVSTGKIIAFGKFPIPFKMHEPLMNALQSFDMGPSDLAADPDQLCDTTVFVFFAESQLKMVKFYYDGKTKTNVGNENDYEECMYIGSWTSKTVFGPASVPPMFYTADEDDREVVAASESVTQVMGTDLGWVGPYYSDNPLDLRLSDYWRLRRFREVSSTIDIIGKNIGSGIVIPEGLREGYIYAIYRTAGTIRTSRSSRYKHLRDPNEYEGRRLLFESDYQGKGCFTDQRKVDKTFYYPSNPCALDFADQGSWASRCDTMALNVESAPPGVSSSVDVTGPTTLDVKLRVGAAPAVLLLMKFTETAAADEWLKWRTKSPDDFGNVQHMMACHSGAVGEFHMVYDMRLEPDGARKTIGRLLDNLPVGVAPMNFIGVL